jgi:hypothetical protein
MSACDPARRIRMKNLSSHDAEIIWIIKEDSILSSPFFMNNSREAKFQLKPQSPYNKIELSTGIGNWSESQLKNILDDIESLTIKSHHGEIRVNSEELVDFLWPRRRGLDKGKIYIYIRD